MKCIDEDVDEKVSNECIKISKYLFKRSESEYGKCLFAFANGGCGCNRVLGVFESGSQKLLKNILIYNNQINSFYEIDLKEIYSELINKSIANNSMDYKEYYGL